jgi:WD40 repeat protein
VCEKILERHADIVNAIAYSPNGETLASASDDTTIRLWHVVSGVCEKILWGHTGWVEALAYSPDGKTLASGSQDRTIRLWATGYVDTEALFGDIKNAAKTS